MTVIKFRRDTSANWTSINPIPAQGEPCYETDTGKLKIGNGSDTYTALPYVSDDGGAADLPIASTTTLGGIKVGDNLTITADGTLSASAAGTTDYTQLENKPQINSVELAGNKTLDDLGIQAKGDYLTALPDNAVTTDTEQTITGKKSLPLSTTLGRFSFGVEGFDDSIGKMIWTLDNGDTAGLDISRYHWYGFLRNGQKVWYIEQDDTNNVQTWTADKKNIRIRTSGGSALKVIGKNDGVDLELTNDTGAFSFLRSKDVDGNTITFSDGVLKANIPSVNIATADTVGTVKPDNTTITVNSEGTISMVGTIPTKTSELENDSGFLTEAPTPTNMVTTDTTQTISGSKTFTKSITTTSIYPSDEITFNSASTSRYINNVDSIAGGYHAENGYLTFKGTTTLQGDDKLVLDGRNGGITLQADSGKLITANNILLCSAGLYSDAMISTAGKSIIAANADKSVSVGQYQYNTILNNPVVAYTSTTNSSIYFSNYLGNKTKDCITYDNGAIEIYAASGTAGTTEGTSFRVTDLMKTDILAVDFNGNITGNGKTYINSENIDTTYMKWDTANKKLTVDTAAVAHLAMPSNTSVDLTLGASGTTYTAPAGGYFTANTSSSYTGWFKIASICAQGSTPNGHQFACSCATRNGESPKVWYSFSSGDTSAIIFKFVYANGTVPST